MVQDISPSKLKNEYIDCCPKDGDRVFMFNKDGKVLLGEKDGRIVFTDVSDIKEGKCIYLFAIDDDRFFLSFCDGEYNKEGFEYYTVREVRDKFSEISQKEIYAVFTAYHLWRWYADNKYCGRCKGELIPGEKERSLVCPDCNNIIYPRINPAVIVGVTKGDCILLTRYRRGYGHNALVAGFTEIGETLEETVKREVKEETGVEVTNIRYYKSQPWGMAQDMLVGFYCDAVGDGKINMDENELKSAEWVKREDIELQPNNLSLTNEMMRMFKEGKC
ncbi:NAD+ diphosphatase [Lachnospiraceae bacterium G41]|nr:NAD+ diphosphatase [Lachnospiraceae bacterium G41]